MPDIFMSMPSTTDDGGDILTSTTFDAEGNPIRDLALAAGADEIKQLVFFILRTQIPDFQIHTDLGSRLEDLIGMPNTADTGQMAIGMVKEALQNSPLLARRTIDVRAVPTSASDNSILLVVTVSGGTQNLVLPVVLNLSSGIQYR